MLKFILWDREKPKILEDDQIQWNFVKGGGCVSWIPAWPTLLRHQLTVRSVELSREEKCSSSCHTQTEEPLLSNSRVASVKQVVIAFIKEFLKIVFMHNATVCAQTNTQFVKLFSLKLKCAVSPAETEVPNVCVSKQNKTNSSCGHHCGVLCSKSSSKWTDIPPVRNPGIIANITILFDEIRPIFRSRHECLLWSHGGSSGTTPASFPRRKVSCFKMILAEL